MNKQNNRYPNQPDNEIWFYDKDKPYYQLTNFYASPIKSKLPIEPFEKSEGGEIILDEKGKIPAEVKYFYRKGLLYTGLWNKKDKRKVKENQGQGDEIEWKTSEHLFQACKLTAWKYSLDSLQLKLKIDEKGNLVNEVYKGALGETLSSINLLAVAIDKIIQTSRPAEVRNFVNRSFEINKGIRNDWHYKTRIILSYAPEEQVPMKIRAMRFVVREKFNQNPKLKKLLWETGNKKLVEHSLHDKFWGDGGDGSGENWLGKILMEIRTEIVAAARRGEWNPSEIEAESSEPNTTAKDNENKEKIALINKNISEIRAKLSAAEISAEQEIEILGTAWETDYQINWMTSSQGQIENTLKEALGRIDEWVTRNKASKNKKPDKPDSPNKKSSKDRKIPVPLSPTENDQIRDKLNTASENNDSDDIFSALKNNQKNIVNSTDKDLQETVKNLEDKLNKLDKEKSIRIAKDQIQTVLEQEEIKGYDLPVPIQLKYSELNNNNNTIRDEIVQEIGKLALNKLIVALERVLFENNKTEIKKKEQDLRMFVNSEVRYRKQAIQTCQVKINYLFQQTQQKLSLGENNNDSPPFFRVDNPLLCIFGVVIIGTVIVLRKLRLKRV